MNGEFYNSFSTEEKEKIVETSITTNDNPWYGTNGGGTTKDKIFLLSIEEVVKYFSDSGQLNNIPSETKFNIWDEFSYARIANDLSGTAVWWWLRSPGGYRADDIRRIRGTKSIFSAAVDSLGGIDVYGENVSNDNGLRPALILVP